MAETETGVTPEAFLSMSDEEWSRDHAGRNSAGCYDVAITALRKRLLADKAALSKPLTEGQK